MRNASGAAFAVASSPGSDTELSIWAAPNWPAPRATAAPAAGIEDLERADRRDHDRQAQFAAEYLGGGVDLGDIAQHPRPERDLVERHAVAAHGGLGLRGADDIIPGVLVQPGAGLAHEFVEILEFFAAGAEFDIPAPAGWGSRHSCVFLSRFGGTLAADKREKLPL